MDPESLPIANCRLPNVLNALSAKDHLFHTGGSLTSTYTQRRTGSAETTDMMSVEDQFRPHYANLGFAPTRYCKVVMPPFH